MSSIFSWFTAGSRTDSGGDSAKQAIANLQRHLKMQEKEEAHLNRRIEAEYNKAKDYATKKNKRAALGALRRKNVYQKDLEQMEKKRMNIEAQLHDLESASMNLETMNVMKDGARVLKKIHGNMDIDKVVDITDEIGERMNVNREISQAISNPLIGNDVLDEDELAKELEELVEQEQQERLDEKLLAGVVAPAVPITSSGRSVRGPARASASKTRQEEEDLRDLLATMAM
jgi:charged multivesicular body protein 4